MKQTDCHITITAPIADFYAISQDGEAHQRVAIHNSLVIPDCQGHGHQDSVPNA